VATKTRGRDGWERLSGGTGGKWRHLASGWIVRHCGHPTALWPYYGLPPGGGHLLIAPNGRAFRLLAQAQQAVEYLLSRPEDLAEYAAAAGYVRSKLELS
jgi:hypothetical protein